MVKTERISKNTIEDREKQRETLHILDYQAYAYRSDKVQQGFLNKATGCTRFVYNKLLYLSEENYKDYGVNWSVYEYKTHLPELKKRYPFLKECPSQALQETVRSLDNAYKKYFKGESFKPVFKKKKNRILQHWHLDYTNGKFGKLYIPKIESPLKIRIHRKIKGTPNIVKEPSGQFFAVISCIRNIEKLPPATKVTGIDLGISNYITTSQIDLLDDIQYNKSSNPEYLKGLKQYDNDIA